MVRSSASSGITEAQSFSENSQLHDSKNRKINCIKLWRISEYSKVFAAQMHRCHHQCRHWSQLQESEGYPFKSQDWKTHGTIEALNRSGFQLWPHARSSSIFRHCFKFSSSRHLISISSSSMALALVDDVLSVRHSQCMNWPTMRSCKVGRREGIQTAVKD